MIEKSRRAMLAAVGLRGLLIFSVIFLAGCECYQSTAPWWPRHANINVPGLEGRWVSLADPKKSYRVKWIPDSQSYFVDIFAPHEPTYQAFVTFTRINHQLVADATARSGQYDMLKLPVHMPFPISLQGNELSIFMVTNEAMKAATAKYHVGVYKIKYSDEDSRDLICTNSSEQLYKILRHALSVEDKSRQTAFDKLKKRP